MDFKNQKKQILSGTDLSRKGCIDEPISELVTYINELDDYVTTSSCSGRAILYCSAFDEEGRKIKKDCTWLYTSHDRVDPDELLKTVNPGLGDLNFKFEPFILHIQCSSIDTANLMHKVVIGCGFRESGLTISRTGKCMLAVRSNIRLEVPMSEDGVMLVSDMYIKYIADKTNEKFEMNNTKIKHFFVILKEFMSKKYAVNNSNKSDPDSRE